MLQELPTFEPEPGERVLWSERRPRPLASFARSPMGMSLGATLFSMSLQLVSHPPRFEPQLSAMTVLTGVMALAALSLLGMTVVAYLRHANGEVVLTDRRVLRREPGRTLQSPWTSIVGAEAHPRILVLSCRESVGDDQQGVAARWFVQTGERPDRLVCPLAEPRKVWSDLQDHGIVALELIEQAAPQKTPLGPTLVRLFLGVALMGAALYSLVELRPGAGLFVSGSLGLLLLGIATWVLIPALRRLNERWVQVEDPSSSEE